MVPSRRISLLINLIFLIILALIILYIIFRSTESLYARPFKDKRPVTDERIINELQESITKYYDYLYFGQYERARHATTVFSRKSNSEYKEMHDEIMSYGEFVVVIKYAYKLYGNTYRCYVTTYDKTKDNLDYIVLEDKAYMNEVIISLDSVTDNFCIVYENYYNI